MRKLNTIPKLTDNIFLFVKYFCLFFTQFCAGTMNYQTRRSWTIYSTKQGDLNFVIFYSHDQNLHQSNYQYVRYDKRIKAPSEGALKVQVSMVSNECVFCLVNFWYLSYVRIAIETLSK